MVLGLREFNWIDYMLAFGEVQPVAGAGDHEHNPESPDSIYQKAVGEPTLIIGYGSLRPCDESEPILSDRGQHSPLPTFG